MRLVPQLVVLPLLVLSACASPGGRVEGGSQVAQRWRGCFYNDSAAPPRTACGELALTRDDSSAAVAEPVYWARSTVPLHELRHDSAASWPPFGAARIGADGSWTLLLGVAERVSEAHDDGSFHAVLRPAGDSLVGSWERSCLTGCYDEGGRVVLAQQN